MIGGSTGERLWVEWAIRRDGSDKPGEIGKRAMVVNPKTSDGDYGFAGELGEINKPGFSWWGRLNSKC